MPAAIPAELKEKVKLVAIQVGVREAARAFQLKEGTVQYWSANEGWLAQKADAERVKEEILEVRGLQPLSTKSPSEVLQEYSGESKLQMAHGLAKTSKAWTDKDDDYRLKNTQALANLATTHAKLFPEANTAQSLVNVNILAQSCDVQVPNA